jgi:hypothetical protein
MKKWILFLLFILAFQCRYKITPVLAQDDKGAIIIEAKKVIEKFVQALDYRDLNAAMQCLSANYSDITPANNIIDYTQFKSSIENWMVNSSKKYIDVVSTIEILKSDIQDNMITAEIQIYWRGFNRDTGGKESGKQKKQVTLVKENGLWKITRWHRIQ